MSLFLLVDGVLYRSRPAPDDAGRTWEPAFPGEFDVLSMPATEEPVPERPTPVAPRTPAPGPLAGAVVPPGLVELWRSVPPPQAPPSGNSEIVAPAMFRPRSAQAHVRFAPPDLGIVEPVDPDSRPSRNPEQPVLVAQVMSRPVDCLTRQATVADALEALEHGGYHHLPVVDEQHRLMGILSDRDLLAAPSGQPVTEVMTARVLVAAPSTPLYLACEGMWSQRVSSLTVIDGNYHPVGILTVFDVLSHLVRHPQRLFALD